MALGPRARNRSNLLKSDRNPLCCLATYRYMRISALALLDRWLAGSVVAQENLFFGQNVSRMCDLKGAHRKPNPTPHGEVDNDTVVDENLFRFNDGYPLLLSEVCNAYLMGWPYSFDLRARTDSSPLSTPSRLRSNS